MILGKPNQNPDTFPWRPMDNREKRAAWAARYYLRFKPFEHPIQKRLAGFDYAETRPIFGIEAITEFSRE